MGVKLKEIYNYVEKDGGKMAVLRLILVSRIPRPSAEYMEDTLDNIEKLKTAAKKVLNKEKIPV